MIRVETDPSFLNRIANSQAVRPWVDYRGVDEPMDFTPACARYSETGVVILSNGEDAFACFEMTGEQEFEGHTFFDASCRGRKAIDTGKEMLGWMMDRGARRIWGATPLNNRKARVFNRMLGMKACGFDKGQDGGDVEIFEMVEH